MKLSTKLTLLTGMTAVGLIILGLVSLQTLNTNLVNSSKNEIKTVLALAKNQVSYYVEQEAAGEISREVAEQRVIEVLSNMRAGDSYIWSNDNNAISRVHPKTENVGTFQASYAGHAELLKDAEYNFSVGQYSKPGGDELITKVNGITRIPEWDWIMGIGVYMDDVKSVFWNFALKFIGIGVAILAIILASSILLARNILKKIGGEPDYAAFVTNEIANGNLNQSVTGVFSTASLLGSISRMKQSLQDMVGSIYDGSTQLTESANDLNEQMKSISAASTESATASQATAAAIHQLSACIESIAESARLTEQNSEQSSLMSNKGSELVEGSAATINEISEQITLSTNEIESLQKRSMEIGAIVNTIREIAEQTNLLALNAAIEAARAGDQGRGFAVVADEVRTLASRTATATSEITETINIVQSATESVAKTMQAILPKVEVSVTSSAEVKSMLGDIRTGADETLRMIQEVSHSASEQNTATISLAEHVEEIHNMVNDTAETVVESSKSVAQLDELATGLHESVSRFRV